MARLAEKWDAQRTLERARLGRNVRGFAGFLLVPLFFTWAVGSSYPLLSLIFVIPAAALFFFLLLATKGGTDGRGLLVLPTVILAGCIVGMAIAAATAD